MWDVIMQGPTGTFGLVKDHKNAKNCHQNKQKHASKWLCDLDTNTNNVDINYVKFQYQFCLESCEYSTLNLPEEKV